MSPRTAQAAARPLLAVLALAVAGAVAAADLPRVHMMEEDSHPHEVRPGAEARFHTPDVARPSRIDVKCTLRGPVRARIVLHGIDATGWALANPRFILGAGEIGVDIEGVVRPGVAQPYFAFANDDPARLLWHQCYNN